MFWPENRQKYCTGTTNPATGIAENGDRRPADLVVTAEAAGNFRGDQLYTGCFETIWVILGAGSPWSLGA